MFVSTRLEKLGNFVLEDQELTSTIVEHDTSGGLKNLLHRQNFYTVMVFYGCLRAVLALASLVAEKITHESSWLTPFAAWDGHWYIQVAKTWYGTSHTIAPTTTYSAGGFEPGWPLLIKVGTYLGLSGALSAFVMSVVLGGLTVYGLWLLSVELVGESNSKLATLVVLAFPGSAVVFGIAYSEVLSIGLAAFTLIFALKGKWLGAALVGVILTLTSAIAVVIAIPLLVESIIRIRSRRDYKSFIPVVVAPLGFLGFVLYLGYLSGDLLYWWKLQGQAWGAKVDPIYIFHWVTSFSGSSWGMYWVAMAGLLLTIVLLWVCIRSPIPLSVKAYCLSIMVMILINPALGPKPRFLFWMFPALLCFPLRFKKAWLMAVVTLFAWVLPLLFIAYTTLGNVVAQP